MGTHDSINALIRPTRWHSERVQAAGLLLAAMGVDPEAAHWAAEEAAEARKVDLRERGSVKESRSALVRLLDGAYQGPLTVWWGTHGGGGSTRFASAEEAAAEVLRWTSAGNRISAVERANP